MNVDVGIWNKLTKLVVGLLLAAGIMIIALWYLPVIRENERRRRAVIQLDAQIAREEAAAKQAREAIETLRNDPKAVERLAREKLGYAKPGETVILFEAPTTASAVRTSSRY
jgi:cell division protein FtsB